MIEMRPARRGTWKRHDGAFVLAVRGGFPGDWVRVKQRGGALKLYKLGDFVGGDRGMS